MVSDAGERSGTHGRPAFDALYHENAGRIYALCLRMSADPGEAERLTQDVFVRAWRRLDSFRGESAFSSWLYRLAVNVVLQDRRTAGRLRARVFFTDEPAPAAARSDSIEDRMDLERAIASLPDGAREALVLHDIEGYTHEEIGRLTGKAAGTIKAQLHRARKLLRERLGP